MSAEVTQVPVCRCGHSARWHSHGGAGACEANGSCTCKRLVSPAARRYTMVVEVADVERILSDTSRHFAGDHLNAGVVVGEIGRRLRALVGEL